MQYVTIAGEPVAIPDHLTAEQKERFHRSHPNYVAPTESAYPKHYEDQSPAAVAAWVEARKRLPALTADELESPYDREQRLAQAAETPATPTPSFGTDANQED